MTDPVVGATFGNLRRRQASTGYDWLILAVPQHVAYATGYRSVAGDIFPSHRIAALVGHDSLAVVAPAADGGALLEHIDPDRYEPFGRFYFEGDHAVADIADRHGSFPDALEAAADRLGVSGVVGVDAGIGAADRSRLGSLPAIRVVDDSADTWLRGVRAVKLPEEVARLETAANLTEQGIETALQAAAPGVRERDLASLVSATIAAGGGIPRFLVVTSGERSALSDARATDRALRPGDLVRFDIGCTFDGYWSDVGRTAIVGEPDTRIRERYDAIAAGEQAQLDVIAPGVGAADVFRVAMDAVTDAGIVPYRRHHCGHGIGTEVYESPIVAPEVDTGLEPGMVLCLETPFYELGWGGMMVEDTVTVTHTGHRRLTRSDRSLRVIEP